MRELDFNGRGESTTIFNVTNRDIQEGLGTEPAPGRCLRTVAAVALIALAVVAGTTRVWNYDIFWHLASGQWMAEHGRVLRHDPFGIPPAGAGPREWVNVHWGFQAMAAGLHRLGGFAALTGMKAALLAVTVGAMVLWLRRRVDAGWLLLVGIWLVVGIEPRVRARPEIFTFAFLAATLLLVESVRQGAAPRRLWWLVPINVLWVNMHGLFVLGPAAAWTAVAVEGARRAMGLPTSRLGSRPALAAMAGATLACLVSPWPLRAALHPLVLWTRMAGHGQFYTKAVTELAPTWRINPLGNIAVLLASGMAVAVVVAMVVRAVLQRRMVPAAHVLWLVMFAVLGAMALRNTGMALVPLSLLLAIHGQGVWDELARRGWIGGRVRLAGTLAGLVLLAAFAGGYATEALYRWEKRPESRWGAGLSENAQPIGPARWLGELDADGDVMPLDFGNGGIAIYFARTRKVAMDGRLELHTLEELTAHRQLRKDLASPQLAADPAKTPFPPSVRFVIAKSEDTGQIEAMAGNPRRFRCLYADASGVLFERIALPGETVTFAADPPPRRDGLGRLDRPLQPGAPLIPGARTRRWYRQNPPALHWRLGAALYSLGMDEVAVRYLVVARELGLANRAETGRILAQAHQRLSRRDGLTPGGDYPADINLSRAIMLYEGLHWNDLAARMAYVSALLADHQFDAAARAAGDLQGARIANPREAREATDLIELVRVRHQLALGKGRRADIPGLRPAERGQLLATHGIGLIDEAIELIRSDPSATPADQQVLGDLYLRKGRIIDARSAYQYAKEGWPVQMRLGLCDWVEGRFARAARRLAEAAEDPACPAPPAVYLALLSEQTGRYAAARTVLDEPPFGPGAGEEQTLRILTNLTDRLDEKLPPRPGGKVD